MNGDSVLWFASATLAACAVILLGFAWRISRQRSIYFPDDDMDQPFLDGGL